jgi:hypothetical protein
VKFAPRKTPCPSCPYRRDVPSGIWEEAEYAKLHGYDGDVPDQLINNATGLFFCHQRTDELCAGWVGCHDMPNNLAVRLHYNKIDADAVFDYESPVPLFASGAEAAEHGRERIENPDEEAQRKIDTLKRMKEMRESNGQE